MPSFTLASPVASKSVGANASELHTKNRLSCCTGTYGDTMSNEQCCQEYKSESTRSTKEVIPRRTISSLWERRSIPYLEIINIQDPKLSNCSLDPLFHLSAHATRTVSFQLQFVESISGGCEMVEEGRQ